MIGFSSPISWMKVSRELKDAGNQAMHAKDGVGFLQMENQTAVLGDGNRYRIYNWDALRF